MATMYARSNLTVWGDADSASFLGWSFSSGGAEAGRHPTSTDDVIFDSNSGSFRTIGGENNPGCRNITISGSGMQIGALINVWGNITLNVFSVMNYVQFQYTGAGHTIYAPGSSFFGTVYAGAYSDNKTLLSDVRFNNATTDQGGMDLNGFTLTTPSYRCLGSAFVFGSGTVVITDAAGYFVMDPTTTVTPGTGTVRFTGGGSDIKVLNIYSVSQAPYNVVNDTTGSGGLYIYNSDGGSSGITLNQLKLGAGSTTSLLQGKVLRAASILADGTASPITIKTNVPGAAATLAKTGGGTVNVDRCTIKDITASPAATFRARSSVNAGNNTNWTFIPGNSNLLQFF